MVAESLMKKAVIDLGTNTFNLLIAEIEEGKIVDISTRKEPVLLGMNGINEGRLSDNAMTRALETLGRFKAICAARRQYLHFRTSRIRDLFMVTGAFYKSSE